jgi:ABC-type arginine/histidine transport system permease subunit
MNAWFTLENALLLAGLGQFATLTASALVPKVLDWKTTLRPLPPFLRTLFWTYGVFIVMTIIGMGTLTLLHAHAMAAGDAVARSLAAFIAVFWGARLFVQLFIFDARPYLTNRWLKLGDHALTLAFLYFTTVYAIAAFHH